MIALFQSIDLEQEIQEWTLRGKYTGKALGDRQKPAIFFQERLAKDDYFTPKRIYLEPNWQESKFSVAFRLDEWESKFNNDHIWDCYISDGDTTEKMKADFEIDFPNDSETLPNGFYQAKVYVTKFETLALSIKEKAFSPEVQSFKIRDNWIDLLFRMPYVFNETISNRLFDVQLTLKKRVQGDVHYHQEEKSFPVRHANGDEFSSSIDLTAFTKDTLMAPKAIWDIFVILENKSARLKTAHSLRISNDGTALNKTFDIPPHLVACFYANDKKAVALSIAPEQPLVTIHQLKVGEGNLTFEGRIHDLEIETLTLMKDSSFEDAALAVEVLKLPLDKKNDSFRGELSFDRLTRGIHFDNRDEFFINATVKDSGFNTIIKVPVLLEPSVELSKEPIPLNRDSQIRLISDDEGRLLFKVKEKTSQPSGHALKVAVSGSCFSRLGFSSADYFNPAYKSKYDIVFTQFHSSMISLMSKPVKFPEEKFASMQPTETERIREDFDKKFFKNLKKTQPDFLILDFYVDGSKDVLLFDDHHAITVNYMLRKNLNYLNEIGSKVTVLNQENLDTFLNYWHEAVAKFAKKITKYVPEERIILQKVRKTEGYYEKNGEIRKFKGQQEYIKRSNYLFEYMENYFLTLLPNVQTIDVYDEKFYSVYDHPQSTTPDHYESDFYKTFMNYLNECILRYVIEHPSYLKKRK